MEKKNKGGEGFLARMEKKDPHHEKIANGIEGLFGRAFEHYGMGIGEVLWKDTFKLEENDKVNDLVYTSEHFQPYMKEAWAHGYKCTRFEDVLRI